MQTQFATSHSQLFLRFFVTTECECEYFQVEFSVRFEFADRVHRGDQWLKHQSNDDWHHSQSTNVAVVAYTNRSYVDLLEAAAATPPLPPTTITTAEPVLRSVSKPSYDHELQRYFTFFLLLLFRCCCVAVFIVVAYEYFCWSIHHNTRIFLYLFISWIAEVKVTSRMAFAE